MLRRHPYLSALVLLCCGLFLVAAVFVATFDLNRYRDQAQHALAVAFSRPITLGEAHLSLRQGLAFSFATIEMPPETNMAWSLDAGRLLLKLKFQPLLRGRIVFSEILLEEPRLRMTLRPEDPGSGDKTPPAAAWRAVGIQNLSVKNGTLLFHDHRNAKAPLDLLLEGLQLRLVDLAPGQAAWLSLACRLRQSAAPAEINVAGEISIQLMTGGKAPCNWG